jgi:hypothetical protein
MSVQRSRVGCQQGMFSSGNSLRFERRPSGIASPTLRTAALGTAPGARVKTVCLRSASGQSIFLQLCSFNVLCAVKALIHRGSKVPPGNWFVPPGSNRSDIGGNKDVEASVSRVALGDLASLQAVTCSNTEQTSKRTMQEPTRRNYGEGGIDGRHERTSSIGHCRGSGESMQTKVGWMQHGRPYRLIAAGSTSSPRGTG